MSAPTKNVHLQTENLSKEFRSLEVWSELNFTLMSEDRAILVGPNGSGKTTLLRTIAGEESVDEGRINLRGKCFYIPQNLEQLNHRSILEIFASEASDPDLQAIGKVATKTQDPGALIPDFIACGGYEHVSVLDDLGLGSIKLDTRLHKLSSGQKMKAMLTALAVSSANLVLLDEPTNHLDQKGWNWLVKFLTRFDGAVLAVSHDRAFIQSTATKIYELRPGQAGLTSVAGAYTEFLANRERMIQSQLNQNERTYKKIKVLTEELRQKVASKSRVVVRRDNDKITHNFKAAAKERSESRKVNDLKQSIDRLKRTTHEVIPSLDISFLFLRENDLNPSFKGWVISRTEAELNNGAITLFIPELSMASGDRIFLTGPNGAGKSTFMRYLRGEFENAAPVTPSGVRIGFLRQEEQIQGSLQYLSLQEYIQNQASGTRRLSDIIRGVKKLGLFREEDLTRSVGTFSLGEIRRLKLLELFLTNPTVLLLDEPTNYMDLDTIEALENTLLHFPGLLVISSHDTWLIEKLSTRKLQFEEGKIREVSGG